MSQKQTPLHQSTSGAYILEIRLLRPVRVQAGALGPVAFRAAVYLYIGSARRGLDGRINRHLRLAESKRGGGRWHIDYLLRHRRVRVLAVGRFPGQGECDLSRKVASLEGVRVPVRGFGSTDCKRACSAHLYDVTGLSPAAFGNAFESPTATLEFSQSTKHKLFLSRILLS